MAPLQGLKGLYPDPQDTTDVMDEGVLEGKANPLHPEHSQYGVQYYGYSGGVPLAMPYSGQDVYDGYDPGMSNAFGGMGYNVPGEEIDRTPVTHASPYPRGILQSSWDNPSGYAAVGEQLRELHVPEMGGTTLNVGFSPTGREEVTHYTTNDYVAPNENYLSPDVPGQLRGSGNRQGGGYGGGNADPTQGYGWLSSYEEFNSGHSIRREQHDSVHFDYTNTHGEQEVPFMGRHPVEQMPLNGPDSPYFDQGNIDGANIPWEGRIAYPTPYQQPVEPTIVPAQQGSDVWAYSGGGF
jgi:hypothetical protein